MKKFLIFLGIFLLLLVNLGGVKADIQTGMVSWWKFDGNALDSIGPNPGTVNGAALTGTNCKFGQCYSFDGLNDYISISNPLNISNTVTVALWINTKNVTKYHSMLGKSGSFSFGTKNNNLLVTWPGISEQVSSGANLIKNNWTFIAFTYNKNLTSKQIKFYKNGVNFDTNSYSRSFTPNGNPLLIGTNEFGQYFNGSIDEVMIWNRVLNSTEISFLYNSFNYSFPNQTCIPESNTTFCTRLNKQCGSVIGIDNCGNSRTVLSCGTCSAGYSCQVNGTCIKDAIGDWSGELITNGGFEFGNLTGWTTSGTYWRAGTVNSPYGNCSSYPHNGSYIGYTASGGGSTGYIYQDINLTNYADYIDSGNARINATGWGIVCETTPPVQDRTRVQVMYLFSNKTIIKTPADSGYSTRQPWWRIGVLNDIPPAETRYVRVWGNTYETSWDSGALDEFSVKIKITGSCTPTNCSALNRNCGTTSDGCGGILNCGSCSTGYDCLDGICTCFPESDSAFCTRLGKNCESVTANDNCGFSRTVLSCGSCGANESCNSSGQCVYSPTDWQTGMISWWKFDGNAIDYLGKNNGTLFGALLTTDRNNNAQSAYSFDGIDDRIEAADSNSLALGKSATLSAWIYINSIDEDYDSIINKWSQDSDDEYIFGVMRDSRLVHTWHTTGSGTWGSSSWNEFLSTGTITTGAWHHVAVVRDGPVITFYIDGNNAGTNSSADNNPYKDGVRSFRIGGQNLNGTSRNINGKIDEVIIYNRSLSAQEILDLYNQGGVSENCIDSDNDSYYAYNSTNCIIGNDCNDYNPSINPGATDICDNGIDENCDGSDCSYAVPLVSVCTWKDCKKGAASFSMDDAVTSCKNELEAAGFRGTYYLDGGGVSSSWKTYSDAGHEVSSHTVNHLCGPCSPEVYSCGYTSMDVNSYRLQELEPNIYAIEQITGKPVLSLAWPCGCTDSTRETAASYYYLGARGYYDFVCEMPNVYGNEETTPGDFYNINSLPSYTQSYIDMAINEGKWTVIVSHSSCSGIDYMGSKQQDLYLAPVGEILKYIKIRNSATFANYSRTQNKITFTASDNLPTFGVSGLLYPLMNIEFNDEVTLKVAVNATDKILNVKVNSIEVPFTNTTIDGSRFVLFNTPLDSYKNIEINLQNASQCNDSCTSLGYQCGTQSVCGINTNCGTCSTGYSCQINGTCIKDIIGEVWSGELITNGGFEWGNLTGWTTFGTGGWAAGHHPVNEGYDGQIIGPQAGNYCAFQNGVSDLTGYIYQDVNLASYASYIDSGKAAVNATGWAVSAEHCTPPCDLSEIDISFLSTNKTQISKPVDTIANDTLVWWKVGIYNYPVPVNARYIRMWGTSHESGWDSGSLDSFSVKIKTLSTCVPATCSALGRNCGTVSDGCGGDLNCGTCSTGYTCQVNGTCIKDCVPDCAGKICGSDGCTGTCGTCNSTQTCTSGVCVNNPPSTGPIIVNHLNTNISEIPASCINKAKSDLHIGYSFTSHGSQLVTGMEAIRSYNSLYNFSFNGSSSELNFETYYGYGEADGFDTGGCYDLTVCNYNAREEGGEGMLTPTRTFLNSSRGQDINVIMWSWCSITGSDIPGYLDRMKTLITEYENGNTAHAIPVKFVFITGHSEGDIANTKNNIIRNFINTDSFCDTHECILFDFSDMENYDPDGLYFLDKNVTDGLNYNIDDNWGEDYLARHPTGTNADLTNLIYPNCMHSGYPWGANINCALKGQAAWYMLARIAGWDGNPAHGC